MSMGSVSPLYLPINTRPELAAVVARERFPLAAPDAEPIARIMTTHLYTEALLYYAIMQTLDRALAKHKECSLRREGEEWSILLLSVLSSDGTRKAQSLELKMLHDVVVELPMAGANLTRLTGYLNEQHQLTICFMHSCGKAIVPQEKVQAFHQEVSEEQEKRTILDWTTTTELVPQHQLRSEDFIYPTEQDVAVASIFDAATHFVNRCLLNGSLHTHPLMQPLLKTRVRMAA